MDDPTAWRDLPWLTSKRGNPYIDIFGMTISINPRGDRWGFCIVKGRGGAVKRWSPTTYDSPDFAKAVAYRVALTMR